MHVFMRLLLQKVGGYKSAELDYLSSFINVL